jgi:hypothetical protein
MVEVGIIIIFSGYTLQRQSGLSPMNSAIIEFYWNILMLAIPTFTFIIYQVSVFPHKILKPALFIASIPFSLAFILNTYSYLFEGIPSEPLTEFLRRLLIYPSGEYVYCLTAVAIFCLEWVILATSKYFIKK